MNGRLRLTRRTFGLATGAAAAGLLLGCGSGGSGGGMPDPTKIWLLSSQGRRTSNAAKIHNANKRFATPDAADLLRAHPGDNSKIVHIDSAPSTWYQLFGMGNVVVDARHLSPALRALVG